MYLIWKSFKDSRWVNWAELRDLVVEEIRDITYNTENIEELRENIDLLCNAAMDKKLINDDVVDLAKRHGYFVIDIFDTARNINLIYKHLSRKTNSEELKTLSDAFDMLSDTAQILKWKSLEDKEN